MSETTLRGWRVESRDAGRGQRYQEWWLTDGKESFRMVSMNVGDMLAQYLNRSKPVSR